MFAFCNDESLELNDGFIISFFFALAVPCIESNAKKSKSETQSY